MAAKERFYCSNADQSTLVFSVARSRPPPHPILDTPTEYEGLIRVDGDDKIPETRVISVLSLESGAGIFPRQNRRRVRTECKQMRQDGKLKRIDQKSLDGD